MTRDELRVYAQAIIGELYDIDGDLRRVDTDSRLDEDYKIERQPKFKREFFEELERRAKALHEHMYGPDSPYG
jgi:hypothetical protein